MADDQPKLRSHMGQASTVSERTDVSEIMLITDRPGVQLPKVGYATTGRVLSPSCGSKPSGRVPLREVLQEVGEFHFEQY
jgi:hypothetical protein